MLDPSALDSEVNRLRQRLLSTEDALRNALDHNQQVDQLVQAMRRHPQKSPVKTAEEPSNSQKREIYCGGTSGGSVCQAQALFLHLDIMGQISDSVSCCAETIVKEQFNIFSAVLCD